MALHTRTFLTRNITGLLSQLSELVQLYPRHKTDHTFLFSLSPNIPSSDLSTAVSHLTQLGSQSLGCLSAPLPGYGDHVACAVALFDSGSVVPFRSTIQGRAEVQVGRWHAFRKRDDTTGVDDAREYALMGDSTHPVDWENVWNRNMGGEQLPDELQDLSPADVKSIVYFSDGTPEGLCNSLKAFPGATSLGLMATSTPFITGRPVTLFHNQQIYGSGAVGLALRAAGGPTTTVGFLGTRAISPLMTVTGCEGNMVTNLDRRSNPTQLLLAAIREHGVEVGASETGVLKDEQGFMLGTFRDGKVHRMHQITAGDPSRGPLSLSVNQAPLQGAQVQSGLPQLPEHPCKALDSFVAASENGFVLDEEAEVTWACKVPGGSVLVEWSGV
ncbi:hypothetical protein BD779DRAFT_1517001 [Infundibulicybe gibba]|nr:hypothetical protein BD779DRAFT_1517001 [Infundibulicybe gibba]